MFRRRAIEGSAPFPALVNGVVVARGNEQGESGNVRINFRADTYRACIRARCLRDAEGRPTAGWHSPHYPIDACAEQGGQMELLQRERKGESGQTRPRSVT